jgi:hypothetical protein
MKLDEAKQILKQNGFITEKLVTKDELADIIKGKLKNAFEEGMPKGCLVKQITIEDGEATIRFAGYPRHQKLELYWTYDAIETEDDKIFSLYIDDNPVLDGYADTAKDLVRQIREFFAGSNWFYRRTHG